MRKLPAFTLAGIAGLALAGTAFAAIAPKTHIMNVPLEDGSVAHIEYVGDVAPKVTIAPRAVADAAGTPEVPFPSFAGFDRLIQQMQRRGQEMMRRAQQLSNQPRGPAPYIASFGSLPAGGTSTTVVSISNNGQTCTRTTQVLSQGVGKPPKVTSSISGQCNDAPAPSGGPTHPA